MVRCYQIGYQEDASDQGLKTDEDITVLTIAPHIVKLTPMNPSIKQYVSHHLQYKLPTFTSV